MEGRAGALETDLKRAFERALERQEAGPPARPDSPTAEGGGSFVVDRAGNRVPVCFDMITQRNRSLATDPRYGPPLGPETGGPAVTQAVVERFQNGMTTRGLDALAVEQLAAAKGGPNDLRLAARICASDLEKRMPAGFGAWLAALLEAAPSRRAARVSPGLLRVAERGSARIEAALAPQRNYAFDYFGLQTLAKNYALSPKGKDRAASTLESEALHELPCHLYMRVALGIAFGGKGDPDLGEEAFGARLGEALELYRALSCHAVSHATPTVLNAGTLHPQMSSCFQLGVGDDLESIFKAVGDAGLISKFGGGLSFELGGLRRAGARIASTGGLSRGPGGLALLLEQVQNYADQGGNRRGAFAAYCPVDHADVLEFLELPLRRGGLRSAPELKYALWVSDDFMRALEAELQRPEAPAEWHLFCPAAAPGLNHVYGPAYTALRRRYIAEGRAAKVVPPSAIVKAAFAAWAEAGVPYVLFKDAANRKSNLRNVAPITSSNLCAEVLLPAWSAHDADAFRAFHPDNGKGGENGVCNLAAVCLGKYVVWGRPAPPRDLRAAAEEGGAAEAGGGSAGEGGSSAEKGGAAAGGGAPAFDYAGVAGAAARLVASLNRVIDGSFYPTPECARSNLRHRPVGVGLMGYADVLAALGLPYGSPPALRVARGIAASIYYGALSESCRLAEEEGPYESFEGSPASEGLLAPDLWAQEGSLEAGWAEEVAKTTGWLNAEAWAALRARAAKGIRNSYVTAYMPTATTSAIVGQNESFEPPAAMIYVRKTQTGDFLVVNPHFHAALEARGLWSDELRRQVIAANGSVQGVPGVPEDLKAVFRTAREVHPKALVDTAKAMAPFVCQSMSLNLFLKEPRLPTILSFLMAGWKAGLKTGLYYCHTAPAASGQQSSVRPPAPAPAPAPAPEPAPAEKECSADCTVCGV